MYNYQYQRPQQYQQQYPQTYQAGYQQAYAQPRDGIVRVTGMEGAKAYQMPPNSRDALFDDTDDIVIIKCTDGAGFPSYKRAKLLWLDDAAKPTAGEYVTRDEFLRWKEEMERGQQTIRRRRSEADEKQQPDT